LEIYWSLFQLKEVCQGKKLMWIPNIVSSHFTHTPCTAQYSNTLFTKDRPALKTINLVKEMRNRGVFAMLPRGASQQLPDKAWTPRKRMTT